MPAQPLVDNLFELECDDVTARGSNTPVGVAAVSTAIVDATAGEQLVLNMDWEIDGLFARAMNDFAGGIANNNFYSVTFSYQQIGGGVGGSLPVMHEDAFTNKYKYACTDTITVPAAMTPGIYKLVAVLNCPAPYQFVIAFEEAGLIQIV